MWENDKRNRKNNTEKKKALWANYWAQLHVPGQEFHLEMVFQKWNELTVEWHFAILLKIGFVTLDIRYWNQVEFCFF